VSGGGTLYNKTIVQARCHATVPEQYPGVSLVEVQGGSGLDNTGAQKDKDMDCFASSGLRIAFRHFQDSSEAEGKPLFGFSFLDVYACMHARADRDAWRELIG
jgi:hypothetical protein